MSIRASICQRRRTNNRVIFKTASGELKAELSGCFLYEEDAETIMPL